MSVLFPAPVTPITAMYTSELCGLKLLVKLSAGRGIMGIGCMLDDVMENFEVKDWNPRIETGISDPAF